MGVERSYNGDLYETWLKSALGLGSTNTRPFNPKMHNDLAIESTMKRVPSSIKKSQEVILTLCTINIVCILKSSSFTRASFL